MAVKKKKRKDPVPTKLTKEEIRAKQKRIPIPGKRRVRPSDLEPEHPWEQQPDETPQAFAAFSVYLEGGEERSARETARIIDKYWSCVGGWCTKHDWVRRGQAHDIHLRRILQRANQNAIVKMNDRHAKNALAGIAAAMATLIKHVKTDNNPNPLKMKDRDAIRLLDVATKLERLARGEPDSIQETNGVIEHRHFEVVFVDPAKS